MGHIQTYLFPIGVAGWFLLTLLIEFRGKGSAIIKVGKLAVIWFVLNDICAIVFSIHQQTNHDIQKMHGTPPNFIFVKFMFCLVPWTICLLWAVVFYFRRRLKVSRTAQESATKMNQAS